MKLFNYFGTSGKGVKKEEGKRKFGFKTFFSILGDKIWNIAILNLLFFAVNLPIFGIFAYLASVGGIKFQAPSSVLYQVIHGVELNLSNPAISALKGVVGVQIESSYPGTVTKILLIVGLLVILTFGLSNCGLTLVFKRYCTDEHVETASDFFSAIKKNFKNGILIGVLDILFVFIILFDIVSYRYSFNSFGGLVFFYLTVFISILYLMMRPFIYIMTVTFDIKLKKIIKNSSVLAVAGFKRTVPGIIFSSLIFILNYIIYCYIPALGALLLFMLSISLSWFVQIYASFPVVKKYMIDPFYEEKKVEEKEETVFEDRG